MASFDEVKLEDILHGSFATFNPNTGANKNADSTPTLEIYEEGNNTPMTPITSSVTNKTTGRYRWEATIAAADGFEAGKFYEVWITATVTGTDTVTQSAPVTSFKATVRVVDDLATPTNITAATGITLTPTNGFGTQTGTLSTVTTTGTATAVTTVNGLAANVISAASIAAAALDGKGNWNIGKTGYALTATTGLGNQTANITGDILGSVTGVVDAVTVGINNDKLGYSLIATTGFGTQTGTLSTVTTVNGLAANVITATSIATGALTRQKFADAYYQAIWDQVDITAGVTDSYGVILRDVLADTGTAGVVVAAGSKTGYSLANGTIGTATFAAGAIDATAIADNAITAAKIAANAITDVKINTGAITNAKFAAGAIDATAIASNAITDAKIATGAITSVKFAAGAINAAAIAADAITDAKVAADVTIASVTGNVGGIAGTIQTLDALNTQQDAQHSTTQGRLPAALVSGRMDANTSAINNNVTAATNLAASASTIVRATASGTPTTTTMEASDLPGGLDNDHYNGRVIIWTSGTLAGQATDITDYVGSTKTLTFTAVTSPPANGVTFVIV